jgi:adhesin transport system outer membrane protein
VGEQIASEAVPTQLQSSLKIGDYQDMERAVMQFTPAIKKIEAQIAAQRAEVKEVGAELAPEVYVRAERSYADTASTMSNQLNTSRVYFGFTTHLGAGLSSLQRVESIKTRMIANEMQLQDAKVNLSEQIASEWNNFDSARTRTPILIQALESTQNTFDSTARQFMAGRKSWLEVMNAAREVQQAEFDLADSKAAQIQYQWRLILMSNSLEKILETSVSASE